MKTDFQIPTASTPEIFRIVCSGILILSLFLFSRLWNLEQFPVVSDEAMYINLSQIVAEDFSDRALFRKEGKHPLFMWLTAISLQGIDDPLLAGRVVSVLSGLASLVAIFLIGRMLYSERIAWVACWIYLFCPFTFFFDRLALVESLLCATALWTAWVALKLAHGEWQGPRAYFILGSFAGLSFFTKAGALLFFPIILFIFARWKMPKRRDFMRSLSGTILGAGLWIVPLMLFGKEIGFFSRTSLMQLPQIFMAPGELTAFPWQHWGNNFLAMIGFYISYLTLPLCLVLFLGTVTAIRSKSREDLTLMLWAFFPPVMILLFTKGFYSRYLLLFVPPLILLSARGCVELGQFISRRWESHPTKNIWSAGAIALVLLTMLSDGFFLPGNGSPIR
jgi:4-amino-4-deoxy-L-arabinose transferase-like glycosyltransferase